MKISDEFYEKLKAFSEEVDDLDEVDEKEDWYYCSIFDDLKYADYSMLVPKV